MSDRIGIDFSDLKSISNVAVWKKVVSKTSALGIGSSSTKAKSGSRAPLDILNCPLFFLILLCTHQMLRNYSLLHF